MKIRPKVPGVGSVAGADEAAPAAEGTAARGFAAAIGRASAAGPSEGVSPVAASAIEGIAERYAAGEITRAEAATRLAAAAVDAWPAGALDEASRAAAVEEMAEVLAEDPTFAALLDAAAGGSR